MKNFNGIWKMSVKLAENFESCKKPKRKIESRFKRDFESDFLR